MPPGLRPALDRVAAEIGSLDEGDPARRVEAIRAFFAQHYRYTLNLGDSVIGRRTLHDFLLDDRVGHCEYFATATVMLLRRAGIPARYATGYSVEEWSESERRFVVRARHGHAWALAHLDGRWIEVDTTPGEWAAADERTTRAFWEPLADAWSALWERFERWRADGSPVAPALPWILLATLALAAFVGRRRLRAWLDSHRLHGGRVGMDSSAASDPLAPIDAHFAALGRIRPPSLARRAWIDELRDAGVLTAEAHRALAALVLDHYRARFGPAVATSLPSVAPAVVAWLAAHAMTARSDPRGS